MITKTEITAATLAAAFALLAGPVSAEEMGGPQARQGKVLWRRAEGAK